MRWARPAARPAQAGRTFIGASGHYACPTYVSSCWVTHSWNRPMWSVAYALELAASWHRSAVAKFCSQPGGFDGCGCDETPWP
jgi:hypothetical protein